MLSNGRPMFSNAVDDNEIIFEYLWFYTQFQIFCYVHSSVVKQTPNTSRECNFISSPTKSKISLPYLPVPSKQPLKIYLFILNATFFLTNQDIIYYSVMLLHLTNQSFSAKETHVSLTQYTKIE